MWKVWRPSHRELSSGERSLAPSCVPGYYPLPSRESTAMCLSQLGKESPPQAANLCNVRVVTTRRTLAAVRTVWAHPALSKTASPLCRRGRPPPPQASCRWVRAPSSCHPQAWSGSRRRRRPRRHSPYYAHRQPTDRRAANSYRDQRAGGGLNRPARFRHPQPRRSTTSPPRRAPRGGDL